MRLNNLGADRFRLDAISPQITRVELDWQLRFSIRDSDGSNLYVVVNSQFRAEGFDSAECVSVATPSADLGAVIVGARFAYVEACTIADGVLTIGLSDQRTVVIPPLRRSEAWDLEGGGAKIICMPGGELAIWNLG